ncbi:hypothetical protein KSD_56190 [Ktedonobacter sp. SOSP1-85]|nr:hypothetical protein KSD_56190 [Ktedonobacter sp. SOSP1-85]
MLRYSTKKDVVYAKWGCLTEESHVSKGSLLLLLMRVSSGVIIPLDSYLLQTSTEQGMRGRIFALHSSTYGGVMQISYVLTGYAFEHIGIPFALGC